MSPGVVIVNFNHAALATDAALSVLGDDPDAHVVIVDNASTDYSLQFFKDVFFDGVNQQSFSPVDMVLARPDFACASKVKAKIYAEHERLDKSAQLHIIRARKNQGFAAGTNIGLSRLRAAYACPWYLLLNPDAIVATGALAAFRERLSDRSVGLCGATVLRFEAPEVIQACGGAALHPLTLLGRNLAGETNVKELPEQSAIEPSMSYPLGAAMAFRSDFLERVGMLDERYFLYYEEADWAFRGRPQYHSGWARGAVVYHHHGASAGSRLQAKLRSPLADYHMTRSRILFAMRWRPALAPFLFGLGALQSARRFVRGHHRQASSVFSALTDLVLQRAQSRISRPPAAGATPAK